MDKDTSPELLSVMGCRTRVVTDRFGKSGKPAELFKEYGLTPENIVKNVKDAIAMK